MKYTYINKKECLIAEINANTEIEALAKLQKIEGFTENYKLVSVK